MSKQLSAQQLHQKKMQTLRESITQKVAYHSKKSYIEIEEFYHLVREFFFTLLEKDYEPTYEEILEEIEHIEHDFISFTAPERERAKQLLDTLSEIEYGGKPIEQEQLRTVLDEFSALAQDFTRMEKSEVSTLLRKAKLAAQKKDMVESKKYYKEAHDQYQKLNTTEQQKFSSELSTVYRLLSS